MTTTTTPARAGWSWPAAARAACLDLLPALLALVPFALVVGVTAERAHAGVLGGPVAGLALYAGTAQLSAVTLLHGGASVATVVLSVAVINARLPLYAAALERHFRDQPAWFRWIGPHFVVDQSFATASARDDLGDPLRFRRYWLATAALLSAVWVSLISVGMVVGLRIPAGSAVIAFAPVALFVPMLAPRLTDRVSASAAGAAAITTALAQVSGLAPPGVPVVVGALAGTIAATTRARRAS